MHNKILSGHNRCCILIVSVFLSPESIFPLSDSGVFFYQLFNLLLCFRCPALDRHRRLSLFSRLEPDLAVITADPELMVHDYFTDFRSPHERCPFNQSQCFFTSLSLIQFFQTFSRLFAIRSLSSVLSMTPPSPPST